MSQHPHTDDALAEILDLGLRAGELLLRHGAETWRIEDTVQRLFRGLGAAESDVVATATSIIASVSDGRRPHTRVRRVRAGTVDLDLIDAVNTLSRRTASGALSLQEVRAELGQIEQRTSLYPPSTMLVASLLGALGFALVFGGGAPELLGTLPGATALALVQLRLGRSPLPGLATTALSALVGTFVAILANRLLPVQKPDVVILSTIVLLVPGAAIVNAIGDLMGGHLLSGLARGAAASLVATIMAAGVVAGLSLAAGLGL